jgi:hypothetical protein
MMKTLNLPEGNAFGVDDIDSSFPFVEHPGENRRKRVLRVDRHSQVIVLDRPQIARVRHAHGAGEANCR